MLKQKNLISSLCILACWVFLTVFLTTPTYAAGEKYAWEDKNKDSLLVSGGDYSVGFTLSKISGNRFADSGGVARDKVSGCLVYVTLNTNSEGTKGRVSVSLDPTSALSDANCDTSKASDISKRFTPDITIDQSNIGRESINNRNLKVQSVADNGDFPADSDTITIKNSEDKEVAKKKTTTKIDNGFEVTFSNIGAGQYSACSQALGQCEDFRQDSTGNVLITKTVVISKNLSQNPCAVDGIGWIVCPVLNFLGKLNDAAYGFLNNFLEVPARLFNDQATKAAWETFKNFANVAFIIAFLVIIYSQITGAGISNYGLKRLLPKLILSAILVNISFYICAFLVDLSNIVGSSLFDLLKNINATPNTVDGGGAGSKLWSDAISAILIAGAAIGLLAVIIFAPMTLLAFGLVILILIARQAFVILLIVISPLAFVAYLLPNTEQWFKKWWKSFTTMLMVFPIIALVFGASSLASGILMAVSEDCKGSIGTNSNCKENGQSEGDDDQLMKIIAAAVLAVPLFAVPVLLKGSLSAAGNIGNRLQNMADRTQNSASKKARNRAAETGKDLKNRFGISAMNPDSRVGKSTLGRYSRWKNTRDSLKQDRETEAKRAASMNYAGALSEKDTEGQYTERAQRLQNAAAGGSILNQADQKARVRSAAMATQRSFKQFDDDVSAFQTTQTGDRHDDLLRKQADKSLSMEERAAAGGVIASRSFRKGHNESLKKMHEQMQAADTKYLEADAAYSASIGTENEATAKAALDAARKEVEIQDAIQKQFKSQWRDKSFGMSDTAMGELGEGIYGRANIQYEDDGSVKKDDSGNIVRKVSEDIYEGTRIRSGSKLTAETIASMNPDDFSIVYDAAMAPKDSSESLTDDQLKNVVAKIVAARSHPETSKNIKPEADAKFTKIIEAARDRNLISDTPATTNTLTNSEWREPYM